MIPSSELALLDVDAEMLARLEQRDNDAADDLATKIMLFLARQMKQVSNALEPLDALPPEVAVKVLPATRAVLESPAVVEAERIFLGRQIGDPGARQAFAAQLTRLRAALARHTTDPV